MAPLALCVAPLAVWGQPLPTGTDESLRQQERERVLREQQQRTPDVRLPSPDLPSGLERLPANEAACIPIRTLRLVGDGAERFQWALAHADHLSDGTADAATGRCLGTQGVNLVMRRIQNALIAEGFVAARVLAGPQKDLPSGTLALTLFPGRIRQIRRAAGTDERVSLRNALPMRPGDVLNLRDLEQALENFKRVPSVEADIQIVPAEGPDAAPGQSDLVVSWQQGRPWRISLSADDAGSRTTGRTQGSLTLAYDPGWALNDLLYLSLQHDLGGGMPASPGPRGTRGATVHYSVPWGDWLMGLTASRSRYHQSVAGASQTYRYSGDSASTEAALSHVIQRDASRKTTLTLKAWTRASHNFIDDIEIAVQRRRTAGWDLALAHRAFIGPATLDATVRRRWGTGAWSALPAPEEPFGEGASRARLVTADAQLDLPWAVASQRLRYTAVWRAQWNRTPLVPQDRFAIGSRYTVRGFDGENQLLADRGWFVRQDVAIALGDSGQSVYAGFDHGEVGGPASALLIGTHLSGAVIGWRGTAQGFAWDLFAARPVSRPSGFRTPSSVSGFNLSWTF